MQKITITAGTAQSDILLGESLKNVSRYLPAGKTVIVTDEYVESLYGKDFPEVPVIKIGRGEQIKTLETLKDIYDKFLEYEVDRSSFILGIGGGIVCDITGFAASTFMRGVPFGFVSTTLLSQVDASIGGKNGVNFHGFKNMIGVFAQPKFVICDFDLLRTLDERTYNSGLAEIAKAAMIKDVELFNFLVRNYSRALQHDIPVVHKIVHDSLMVKAAIVQADEKEKGERRKLNFGHTLGHAVEKLSGLMHGESISIGIVLAAGISMKRGFLNQEDYQKVFKLLKNFQLPTSLDIDKSKLFDVLRKDKKREGDSINFVFLKKIGEAVVEKITLNEMEELIDDLH